MEGNQMTSLSASGAARGPRSPSGSSSASSASSASSSSSSPASSASSSTHVLTPEVVDDAEGPAIATPTEEPKKTKREVPIATAQEEKPSFFARLFGRS